ncbi:MAG TPA: Hpt domain-containing protein [Bacteriovoracaceae bacterium]|nr:Hpt domain-containing protein [Bacteriovoracaceae bacterium]
MEIPEELAQNYLKRRLDDINSLEKALLGQDFDICKEIGHRLKGSARTFGFKDLEHLALSLEEDAQNEDLTSLAEDINSFKTWVYKYIN